MPVTTPTHLWNGKPSNASLRGKLIQHGSRLKRAWTADIARLLSLIATLEEDHKRSPDEKIQLELTNARRDLLQIFAQRSLVARDKWRFAHYLQANQCGKHLAQTLQPKQARKSIPCINSPNKGKIINNSSIVEEFRQYYDTLYNLKPQTPSPKLQTDPRIKHCPRTFRKLHSQLFQPLKQRT